MSAANFSDSHLKYLLRSARQLTVGVEFLKSACLVFATLLSVFLLAVVADGLLGLQSWGLLAADVVGLLCLMVGLAWVGRQIARHWLEPRGSARLLEQRLGLRDNRLMNAFDLDAAPPKGASPELVRQTIRHGEEFAKEVSVGQTLRLRPLAKAAGLAVAVVLIVLGSVLLAPRLYAAVLPRLLDPLGDHPPFTLVEFNVTVEPSPVLVGRSAAIVAKLGGPETMERANVVFVEGNKGHTTKLPMLRRPEGEFILPIDRAESSREFYIDTPRGRSVRYQLTVLPVPAFEASEVRYTFPPYTGWPETRHILDSRGIRALTGTTATVTISSNVPLKQAIVQLVPQAADADARPTELALLPGDNPKTVSGSFTIQFSGHFKITLTGEDGTEGREHLEGSLTATPDQSPQIEFTEPAPTLLAVEDFKIPVGLSAQDDVALAEVVLRASINGLGPHQVNLSLDHGDKAAALKNTFKGRYEFDLAALGAVAGDVITYYATARDNAPPAGQTADTPTYTIQVISREEYLDFARTKYRMDEITEEFEMLQKELQELKTRRDDVLKEADDLKEKLAAEGALSKEEQHQLEQLQKRLEEFGRQAEQLSKKAQERAEQPQLYDFEKPYTEKLKQLAEQLQKQTDNARSAKQAAEKLRKQPGDKQLEQELTEALEKLQKESQPFDQASQEQLDKTGEDLKKLQQADQMLAQAEKLQSLIQQQRELADKLGELRDVPPKQQTPEQQQRAQQLAKDQELLKQDLEEVTQELEKLAEECKGSLPKTSGDAKKLAEAIRMQQVPEDQQQAAKSSRAGDGPEAHAKAEEAAKKLEGLQQDCESCSADSMGGEMDLDAGLGLPKPGGKNSLKQLAKGRQMPGSGKPNDKPGDQPGQKPGRAGAEGEGTQTRTQILGPHQPSGEKSDAQQARLGQSKSKGQGPGSENPDGTAAPESITPDSRSRRLNTSGNLRGVPVRYRDQAEAFFRRLAEEQK